MFYQDVINQTEILMSINTLLILNHTLFYIIIIDIKQRTGRPCWYKNDKTLFKGRSEL